MKPRKIGVVTVGRSDYGIYQPLLHLMRDDPAVELALIAGGGHFDRQTGSTISEIERDGLPIRGVFKMPLPASTPARTVTAMAAGMSTLADVFLDLRLDLLVVLGDRFDMFTAAAAAVPFRLPLAHIHGGETTEGAMDEQFRHAITKLSHLHFASTELHASRIRQMGEEPWRILVSGAPALDFLHTIEYYSRADLEQHLNLDLSTPPILATCHPVTGAPGHATDPVRPLLEALDDSPHPLILTYPNIDIGNEPIIAELQRFVQTHPNARLVKNLGARRYLSIMKYAAAMAGNSSSGIIEAASFCLPVVNIGDRQRGRLRARNVIDAPDEPKAIRDALQQALSPAFRDSLAGLVNPYGDGHASEIILDRLKTVELNDTLLLKRFNDLPGLLPN